MTLVSTKISEISLEELYPLSKIVVDRTAFLVYTGCKSFRRRFVGMRQGTFNHNFKSYAANCLDD